MLSAIQSLKQGLIIAYPTEAVYGLGCDPLNETAVLNLLALKNRSITKGLILIAANITQIMPYIDTSQLPASRMQHILSTWPGPYTWVFPSSPKTPVWIRGAHTTIAVRVTAHPVANALCTAFGDAVVSTSANLTGQPPAACAEEVAIIFPKGIAQIVAGHVGETGKPTQIRDAISDRLLRL